MSTLKPETAVGSGSLATFNQFQSINTNTSITVPTATSTQLVSSSTGRQFFIVTNGSAVGAYISLSQPATSTRGIYIAPNGGSFELNANKMFIGPIYAISASSGSATLSVTEQ